jgi:hypothetical protein
MSTGPALAGRPHPGPEVAAAAVRWAHEALAQAQSVWDVVRLLIVLGTVPVAFTGRLWAELVLVVVAICGAAVWSVSRRPDDPGETTVTRVRDVNLAALMVAPPPGEPIPVDLPARRAVLGDIAVIGIVVACLAWIYAIDRSIFGAGVFVVGMVCAERVARVRQRLAGPARVDASGIWSRRSGRAVAWDDVWRVGLERPRGTFSDTALVWVLRSGERWRLPLRLSADPVEVALAAVRRGVPFQTPPTSPLPPAALPVPPPPDPAPATVPVVRPAVPPDAR